MKTNYETPKFAVLDTAVDVITASTMIRNPIPNGGNQSEPEGGYSWDSIF